MARSRRKTPIVGIATADSEKAFKAREHRRERRSVATALAAGEDPPEPKAFGNPWAGDKDGKQWIGDRHPHLLRK